MTRPRIGPFAALALAAGFALTTVVPATVGSSDADAAGFNRAGVVVDPGDGSGPHTACVWFEEASISGLELLARSTFDAGVRAFGGMGGAVCSIDGTGCSTDSACLSCGGSQYWAYATADPGATSFTQAQAGAGGRTITDGAIDGWRWGSGDPPAYLSIDRICPASPPPAPPAPPPPPPVAPDPAPAGPDPAPTPVAPVTVAPAGATATTIAAPTSTTTTSVPGSTVVSSSVPSSTTSTSTTTTSIAAEDPGIVVAAAAIPGAGEADDGSGGTGALAVAAVVLAAGLGAGAFWRMRRSS